VGVGAGAARALAEGARGESALAVAGGAYLALDTGWVLLTGPRAPLGPLSLLVAGAAPTPPPGTPVRVADGCLTAGDIRVRLRGPVPPAPVDVAPPSPGWRAALHAATAAVPPPPAALAGGLAALARDDLPGAVGVLAGRGEGLTPAGDDVLAGCAAWWYADGRPADDLPRLAAARAAPVGLAYLACAARGEVVDLAAAALAAVRAGDAALAARRARALGAWGATSGAALLWGMAAAAQSATPATPTSREGRSRTSSSPGTALRRPYDQASASPM
jgi:hypothetical protein